MNLGDTNNDGYEGVTFDLAVFYYVVIIMNSAVCFLYVQFNLCPLSITPSDIRTSVRGVLFLASLFFPPPFLLPPSLPVDVAIGAPFVDNSLDANGTVYIYLGSPTNVINTTPYQVRLILVVIVTRRVGQ